MPGDITKRQSEIIRAVVREYIQTGLPVSSQLLVEKFKFDISSATARKEMSVLEQVGLLASPHTSSGRIPTDDAFAYYLEDAIHFYSYPVEEKPEWRNFYKEAQLQIEPLFKSTASHLSSSSNYVGFVLAPTAVNAIIKNIEIVSVLENLILVVLVSASGAYYQKKIKLEKEVHQEELHKISRYLTRNLGGYEMIELQQRGLSHLDDEKTSDVDLETALMVAQSVIYYPPEASIYMEGQNYLFRRLIEEYNDHERAERVVRFISDETAFSEYLNSIKDENKINYQIGFEIDGSRYESLSVLVKSYSIGGRNIGVLGVLGLNRMQYDKIIGSINYSSALLSSIFNEKSSLGEINSVTDKNDTRYLPGVKVLPYWSPENEDMEKI